jgi:MOSC domain-containing protein YiiM
MSEHATREQLEAGLEHIRQAPAEAGELRMIVRRPAVDEREVLETAELCTEEGLRGDTWANRPSPRTEHGGAHPDMQLNIMNARATALIAGAEERWPLAGDQLYLDMDLSEDNLPPGTRLALGEAIIEVTDQPHLGCQKFKARFGEDALRFVNSETGKRLHLRGINARVVQAGSIRRGDIARKLDR